MAGFDNIDPANACHLCSAARAPRAGRFAHIAGPVSGLI